MSCCDDHSEITVTTVSTNMSSQVSLCSLEAKVIKVMAENSRLRSEVKRQASIAARAIEELGNTVQKLQKAIADNQRNEEMEARIKALEKIVVGGERAKTRSSRHASLPDLSSHLESSSPPPSIANKSGNVSVGSNRSKKSRTRKSRHDLSCHIASTTSTSTTATTTGNASVGSANSRRSSTSRKSKTSDSRTKRTSAAKAIAETLQHLEMVESSKQPKGRESAQGGDMSMHMSHMSFCNLDWDFDDTTAPVQEDEFPILSTSMSGSQHFHCNQETINNDKSECEHAKSSSSSSKSKSKRRSSKHETNSLFDEPHKLSPKQTPAKQKSALIWTSERAQELCQPFTPQQIATEQTKDKALADNLVNGGMYPKFCMSVRMVKDSEHELYLFTKCVYVPEHLRQRTMEHYYRKHNGKNWSWEMCRHKIWPTLDADVTNFRVICKK